MKKIIFLFIVLTNVIYAQVGIGTATPNGALDLNPTVATNYGLVPPRVALLTGLTTATVVNPQGGAPARGTMVYNTTNGSGFTPGYYYWETTPSSTWVRLNGGPNTNWSFTGNTGTTAGTNFIGTTDAVDLTLRSNNIERMRILSDGRISVNNASPNAGDQFSSVSTTSAINGYTSTGFGVYGQSTGNNSAAVYGITNNATANGVIASNINATGTGSLSIGNNSTGYTVTGGSGAANNGTVYGTISYGNDTNGWGIAAAGNNLSTVSIAGGGGGSFTGRRWGVFANATINGNNANEATDRAAFVGNFNQASPALATTVYLGARIGSVNYKVLGTGSSSVSTTMPTRDGERILFAPEAPENWFFDIGEVTLVNGKATVTIDPIFVDCIADSKPFKVFVQGGENTLGSIRITRNQEAKTFTVEDLGGESNGIVQYSIYGIWKQKENLRFPKYTQPFDLQEHKKELANQTQIMK